jgi:RNA polymerase sigma-70 factor (ECF subfamily)
VDHEGQGGGAGLRPAATVTPTGQRGGTGRAAQQTTEWFEQHADAVHRYVHALTGDDGVAEDIVQETFARLYQQLVRAGQEPRLGWVYTVARHLVTDWQRRTRWVLAPDLESAAAGPDPMDRVADQDYGAWLLDQLPAHERLAVQLFYYENLSADDIGRHLGISANTVRVRLSRARRRLETRLKSTASDERRP